MTRKSLEEHTCKELAAMAKKKRVTGWHAMRKDELIDALLAAQRRRRYRTRKQANSRQTASSTRNKSRQRTAAPGKKRGKPNGKAGSRKQSTSRKRTSSRTSRKKQAGNGSPNRQRRGTLTAAGSRDRLSARACDAYWIYASWQVTEQMLERARAALGAGWYQAVPTLRVFDVTPGDSASGSAAHLRDIRIHGQINYWYVPAERPSRSYQLEIGYRAPDGRFFALARSNKVRTPRPGARSTRSDGDTSTGAAPQTGFGQSAGHGRVGNGLPKVRRGSGGGNGKDFEFSLDAELVVYGTTHPDTELTLFGEQVSVDKNGMFTQRFNLPEGRQVFPAVAVTPDGSEQRTIVLSVERNVRELEPQPLDETDV